MTSKTTITLYGNVRNDPKTRTISGRWFTRQFGIGRLPPSLIVDDMVEREFTTPEREVWTFSIAVSKEAAEGNDVTRWIRCDDWNRLSRLIGKEDRVDVKGHFRERTYQKDGETKTVRDVVVEDLTIERHEIGLRAESGLLGRSGGAAPSSAAWRVLALQIKPPLAGRAIQCDSPENSRCPRSTLIDSEEP